MRLGPSAGGHRGREGCGRGEGPVLRAGAPRRPTLTPLLQVTHQAPAGLQVAISLQSSVSTFLLEWLVISKQRSFQQESSNDLSKLCCPRVHLVESGGHKCWVHGQGANVEARHAGHGVTCGLAAAWVGSGSGTAGGEIKAQLGRKLNKSAFNFRVIIPQTSNVHSVTRKASQRNFSFDSKRCAVFKRYSSFVMNLIL